MRLFVAVLMLVLLGIGRPCGAADELILPITGPILRDGAAAGDPLCAAPALFAEDGKYVPAGTFAALADVIVNGVGDAPSLSRQDAALLPHDSPDLLRSTVHAARLRGLAEGFADRSMWRIVAMRTDLCDDQVPDCENQFRIVAQPFAVRGLYVQTPDVALHLNYALPDAADLRQRSADLEARALLAGRSLQATLDVTGPACSSPWLAGVQQLIALGARPERLRFIAWMTSSASGQEWTFGRFRVGPNGEMVADRIAGAGFFDNFSKPSLLADACPINSDASDAEKAAFRCPAAGTSRNLATGLLQRFDDPHQLRRPDKLCVSCHLAPILRTMARLDRVNDRLGLPVFEPNTVNPGNLRQFGYDLHGRRTVSDRLRLLQALH